MFKNKIYKRFKKIYDYISDINCEYTIEFDGICYKYKTFKTKMGERDVIVDMVDRDSVCIAYHDFDKSLLFVLLVNKRGRIEILYSRIDEMAIFSAIYELECLIWEHKEEKRGKMLESLLSYYRPNIGGYTGMV